MRRKWMENEVWGWGRGGRTRVCTNTPSEKVARAESSRLPSPPPRGAKARRGATRPPNTDAPALAAEAARTRKGERNLFRTARTDATRQFHFPLGPFSPLISPQLRIRLPLASSRACRTALTTPTPPPIRPSPRNIYLPASRGAAPLLSFRPTAAVVGSFFEALDSAPYFTIVGLRFCQAARIPRLRKSPPTSGRGKRISYGRFFDTKSQTRFSFVGCRPNKKLFNLKYART